MSSSIAAPGPLIVTITGIKNPISTQQLPTLQITTYDENNIIDTQTSNILVPVTTVTTTAEAAGAASIIESPTDDTTVTLVMGTMATYEFTFTNINPIPTSSFISIAVPSTITLPSAAVIATWTYDDNGGNTPNSISYNSVSNSIQINNVFTTIIGSGNTIQFSLEGWTNPSSTTAAAFTITTYETTNGANNAIDYFTGFSISAVMGTLSVTSIASSDNMKYLEYPTSYTFKFLASHSISNTISGLYLLITFPSNIGILDSSSCTVTGWASVLSSSYTCASVSAAGTISIGSIVSSTITAGTSITFTVNKIRNPGVYAAPGAITLAFYTASGEVSTGSYSISSGKYTYSSITTFTVTPVNYTTGNSPTKYTITLTPLSKIYLNAYVQITLPADVIIGSLSTLESDCGGTNSGFQSSYLSCSVQNSQTEVQFLNGFPTTSSSDPPTLSFQIDGLQNPRSLVTTAIFGAGIYDTNGILLFYWSNAILPTVQMLYQNTPKSLSILKTSSQNGALTTYYFTLVSYNYYDDGDIITLVAPSPVTFTVNSKCQGVTSLSSSLSCYMSYDYSTIYITVAVSRRRMLNSIASGTTIKFGITEVQNSPSFKPTSLSFQYSAKTSVGSSIEQQTTGLTVTNNVVGAINYQTAFVSPDTYLNNTNATYTFSFVPVNFVQGMVVKLTVPSQITIPSTNITCKGLTGTDYSSVICTASPSTNTIVFYNGFDLQRTSPANITLQVLYLTNPSNLTITNSFQIATYTSDSYAIDLLQTNLIINFECEYPCKTCLSTNVSSCLSCYTNISPNIFYQQQCIVNCPNTYYNDYSKYICSSCISPCLDCYDSGGNCTSCIDNYYLSGSSCIENGSVSTLPYIYPFASLTFVLIFFILVSICCHKKTRFLESSIALVAIPEFLSWAFLLYMFWFNATSIQFYIVAGGIGIHIILNAIYGIFHAKKIIPSSSSQYFQFIKRFAGFNGCSLFFSSVINFKMHLLTLSSCAGGKHLQGQFNKEQWKLWNQFVISYLCIIYPLNTGGCIYYLYINFYSKMLTWTWGIALEVSFISTLMALLLIILMCSHRSLNDKESSDKYNKVQENSLSASLDEHEIKKTNKKNKNISKVHVEDEDDIDIIKNRKRNLTTNNSRFKNSHQELIEDDDIENLKHTLRPQKGRNGKDSFSIKSSIRQKGILDSGTNRKKLIDNSEDEEAIPTNRSAKKKAKFLDDDFSNEDRDEGQLSKRNQFKDGDSSDDLQNTQSFRNPQKQQTTQEMKILEQFITMLRDEKELLQQEKKAIMKEKKRQLEEMQRSQAQIQKLQNDLAQDKVKINEERQQLEELRKNFLEEVDKRVQQKLEDWDNLSTTTKNGLNDRMFNKDNSVSQLITPQISFKEQKKGNKNQQQQSKSLFKVQPIFQNLNSKRESQSNEQSLSNIPAYKGYANGNNLELNQNEQSISSIPAYRGQVGQGQRELNINEESFKSIPAYTDNVVKGEYTLQANEESFTSIPALKGNVDPNMREIQQNEAYLSNLAGIKGNVDNNNIQENNQNEASFSALPKPIYEQIELNELENNEEFIGQPSSPGKQQQKPSPRKNNNAFQQDSIPPDNHEIKSIELLEQPDNQNQQQPHNKEEHQDLYENDSIKDIMNKSIEQDDNDYQAERQDEVSNEIHQKKKKKVLYSDKSESSIDEMMHDTPSNYNIPNGRLDGKSLGLKAHILMAKKQAERTQAKTQLKSNDLIANGTEIPQRRSPVLGPQNRFQKPKLQPEEERKFVNNLFRESQHQQSPHQTLVPSTKITNNNLNTDQISERAGWGAFSRPTQKPFVLDDAQSIEGYDASQKDGSQFGTLRGDKKEGKKRNNSLQVKKFKELQPNNDRLKAMENVYMQKQSQVLSGTLPGKPQSILPKVSNTIASDSNKVMNNYL